MVRPIFLFLFLSTLAFTANSAEKHKQLNPLEKMLAGFSTCDFQGVHIDWQTNKAVNPYLNQLAIRGLRIEEGFARFNKIDQTFHGFKVLELLVPARTWTAHRLILDASHTKARPILERALRTKLPQTSPLAEDSEDIVPLLWPYPGKPNWSVLECDSPL